MPVCPSCESSVLKEKFIESYTAPFNNQEYKLYHCPKCDLQWWEPLKIVPEFYEQEGEETYAIFHMGINQTIGENHKMFFKHMPLKSGRLLDVGCGDGVFLVEAQRRGYEVWGIDFDRKSIQVCQEKRGLKNTFAMTPWEFAEFCQKENLKFDIITFFEVLEHQDKPKEFLEAVKSMLKSGGWIAGSVPNRDSWLRSLFDSMFNSDKPPHHFLRFSEVSLRNFFYQGLAEITTYQVKPKLSDIAATIQYGLINKNFIRTIKKRVLGSELASEGNILHKQASNTRRIFFKFLKISRDVLLSPATIPIKYLTKGNHIYFHATYGVKNETF
ncbi:MAG: class I SAM-dependent methyltransferase [Thermodesulfovibrio sp.]|nr:class I SAM-dependent methyltransferase [Thermodesulfovibrio sp.]